MENEYQLVVADIDGTLIEKGAPLGERSKDAIRRLREHGVYFGIASGRDVDIQVLHQYKVWGFDRNFEIVIGMNGSQLYDGIHQKRYDYYKLKTAWMKEIIELMEPYCENMYIYWHGKILALREDDEVIASAMRTQCDLVVAKDPSEMWQEENAKIMVRVAEEKMPEMEAYAAAHEGSGWIAFKTQPFLLEFTDRRVSKAVALENFCRFNSIPLSRVMAFGDMSNDNEMLKAAGCGVCLKNGGDDTKACADAITRLPVEQEGFADYIEQHILLKHGW